MNAAREKREKIAISIDRRLLERVDGVAESRAESRSGVIERMLLNEIDEEEGFLRKMENPVTRILFEKLMSSPRLIQAIACCLLGPRGCY